MGAKGHGIDQTSPYCTLSCSTDLILRKVNESDASQFAKLCPILPARAWGVLWLLISLIFFAAAILLALVAVSSLDGDCHFLLVCH